MAARKRKGDRLWKEVNTSWPEDLPMPSDAEAIAGTLALYTAFMKKPWTGPVRVARGRSHTWVRRGELVIGPEYWHPRPGWPAIVHDLSHYIHRQRTGERPHGIWQAWLEREMQRFALQRLLSRTDDTGPPELQKLLNWPR